MSVIDAFRMGDHIEVRPLESERGTHKDWGVLRGTAHSDMSRSGSAIFFMEVPSVLHVAAGDSPIQMRFNANEVDVRLLFSARVARLS
jgi:hypothetical protein